MSTPMPMKAWDTLQACNYAAHASVTLLAPSSDNWIFYHAVGPMALLMILANALCLDSLGENLCAEGTSAVVKEA